MKEKSTVVITGASRRLGLFLCEKFIAADYKVYALTRSASKELNHLSQENALVIIELESYEFGPVSEAIDAICSDAEKINVLVHNVSAFDKDDAHYADERYTLFYRLHMALPAQLNMGLKERLYNQQTPGVIVHITDIFADTPSADHVLYCSTKAGLENLSKGFAKKFAPGIRVNTIQPGPIKFLPSHTEAAKQHVLSETLLGREGGFMPIFQALRSIVENTYMTGACIKVDGGRALGNR